MNMKGIYSKIPTQASAEVVRKLKDITWFEQLECASA